MDARRRVYYEATNYIDNSLYNDILVSRCCTLSTDT